MGVDGGGGELGQRDVPVGDRREPGLGLGQRVGERCRARAPPRALAVDHAQERRAARRAREAQRGVEPPRERGEALGDAQRGQRDVEGEVVGREPRRDGGLGGGRRGPRGLAAQHRVVGGVHARDRLVRRVPGGALAQALETLGQPDAQGGVDGGHVTRPTRSSSERSRSASGELRRQRLERAAAAAAAECAGDDRAAPEPERGEPARRGVPRRLERGREVPEAAAKRCSGTSQRPSSASTAARSPAAGGSASARLRYATAAPGAPRRRRAAGRGAQHRRASGVPGLGAPGRCTAMRSAGAPAATSAAAAASCSARRSPGARSSSIAAADDRVHEPEPLVGGEDVGADQLVGREPAARRAGPATSAGELDVRAVAADRHDARELRDVGPSRASRCTHEARDRGRAHRRHLRRGLRPSARARLVERAEQLAQEQRVAAGGHLAGDAELGVRVRPEPRADERAVPPRGSAAAAAG